MKKQINLILIICLISLTGQTSNLLAHGGGAGWGVGAGFLGAAMITSAAANNRRSEPNVIVVGQPNNYGPNVSVGYCDKHPRAPECNNGPSNLYCDKHPRARECR